MTDRLAIIRASAEFLVEFCKPGPARFVRIVGHALPADATFVRGGCDETGTLQLVVRSASFAELEPGDAIPMLPPTLFEIVYDGPER